MSLQQVYGNAKGIRVSVKAVIIQDGQLLAMQHRSQDRDYYLLPGGGQRNAETLVEAIQRECMEEAGIQVSVGDVVFIRDYIEKNHEFAGQIPGFHQVEIMFRCEITDGRSLGKGTEMDTRQIGVRWLPLDTLDQYRLYPAILKEIIPLGTTGCIYLGDVN